MNCKRSTRVCLTRKLANVLNGVDLSRFNVGDHLDLPPHDAWLVIAEGWAVACTEPPPQSKADDAIGRANSEGWIQQFESTLEALAAEPSLTAAMVAQKMNLSRWHFSRLLLQRTRMPFRMHLSRTRLRVASRLLRESALSIKEVSFRAGFSSASELNHHFRRVLRMTPTQYRSQAALSFQRPAESQTRASISNDHQALNVEAALRSVEHGTGGGEHTSSSQSLAS
jgi:AraC-like DNA-binding protein